LGKNRGKPVLSKVNLNVERYETKKKKKEESKSKHLDAKEGDFVPTRGWMGKPDHGRGWVLNPKNGETSS